MPTTMRLTLPLLLATTCCAYWYPNSYTRTPSPDEDCYSQVDDPYSITCYATQNYLYAPCSDLFIPSTSTRPNNFTYRAICTFPDPHWYDEDEFWSEIITVEVCENYWDACMSDNVLAKYDDSITYGLSECRKVTNKACGKHRVHKETIPGSEPEDTTLGAFNLGPYSTVSQVMTPRGATATGTSDSAASSISRIVVATTGVDQTSVATLTPGFTTIPQESASMAERQVGSSNMKLAMVMMWLPFFMMGIT